MLISSNLITEYIYGFNHSRLHHSILAALATGFLLSVAHSPGTWNLWGYLSLVPLLIVTRSGTPFPILLISSLLASIAPTLIMVESVAFQAPLAAFLALLLHTPQILGPLTIWAYSSKARNSVIPIVAFTCAWIVWEELRALPVLNGVFASFYSIAYTQEPTSLWSGYPVASHTLLCLTILFCNGLASKAVQNRRPWLLLPCTVLILVGSLGSRNLSTSEASYVTDQLYALQPGFTQSENELFTLSQGLANEYYAQIAAMLVAREQRESIALLPETVLRGADSFDTMFQFLNVSNYSLISGATRIDDSKAHNSVVELHSNQVEGIYDKWQLVPAYETNLFQAGDYISVLELPNGGTIGILVCLDGTIPWLVQNTIAAGAELIIILSATDYGRGYRTPAMHLFLTRHQAARWSIPIIFLSTNGPSAYVSADGQTIASLEEGVQGFLPIGGSRVQ